MDSELSELLEMQIEELEGKLKKSEGKHCSECGSLNSMKLNEEKYSKTFKVYGYPDVLVEGLQSDVCGECGYSSYTIKTRSRIQIECLQQQNKTLTEKVSHLKLTIALCQPTEDTIAHYRDSNTKLLPIILSLENAVKNARAFALNYIDDTMPKPIQVQYNKFIGEMTKALNPKPKKKD